MPRAKRQPLGAVKSGVRKADLPPKPVVSAALRTAIDTMDHMRLRLWVKHYCETMQPLREDLEKGLLVPGKDVIRYHADSDSEDREEDEEESEESEKGEPPIRPISLRDEDLTPRCVKCVHCNRFFDVTKNDKGDCVWHPGAKHLDDEAPTWDDLEKRWSHPSDFADEDEYPEAFRWSCCDEQGDHEGCKSTKHKSDTNTIVRKPILPPATKSSRKRKAEGDADVPIRKRPSRR